MARRVAVSATWANCVNGCEGLDVVHYLNPIGFKEPSECWRIEGVPYGWGPMQGVENRPLCLWRALGAAGLFDAVLRLVLHNGMMWLSPKIRKAVRRADCIFAATPNTVKQLGRVFGKQTIYLPENGKYTIPDLPGIGQELTDESIAESPKETVK